MTEEKNLEIRERARIYAERKKKILTLINNINILFSKKYYEELSKKFGIEKSNASDDMKLGMVKSIFTSGGCSVYAKFLYELFKDEGAKMYIVDDHMVTEIYNQLYDVNGYNLDAAYEIAAQHLQPFGLEEPKDIDYYNWYRDFCTISSSGGSKAEMLDFYEEILNEIKDDILKNKEEMMLK